MDIYICTLADFEPVKQLVLIGGPDDDVIVPWESRLGVAVLCVTDALPRIYT